MTTHGLKGTSTYNTWQGLKNRCNCPKEQDAPHYKDKGITYDAKWETFEGFIEDMGLCPPGLQLDRIDTEGNYTKANCRWVSSTVNMRNRAAVKLTPDNVREIRKLLQEAPTANSQRATCTKIGDMFGVSFGAIRDIALNRRWSEVK